MLSLRDVVIIGAVVALILYLFRPRGCGCKQRLPTPPAAAAPRPEPAVKRPCIGGLPCGGR